MVLVFQACSHGSRVPFKIKVCEVRQCVAGLGCGQRVRGQDLCETGCVTCVAMERQAYGISARESFRPQVEPVCKRDHVCCRWLGCRVGLPKPVKAHIMTLCAPDAGHGTTGSDSFPSWDLSLLWSNLSM